MFASVLCRIVVCANHGYHDNEQSIRINTVKRWRPGTIARANETWSCELPVRELSILVLRYITGSGPHDQSVLFSSLRFLVPTTLLAPPLLFNLLWFLFLCHFNPSIIFRALFLITIVLEHDISIAPDLVARVPTIQQSFHVYSVTF